MEREATTAAQQVQKLQIKVSNYKALTTFLGSPIFISVVQYSIKVVKAICKWEKTVCLILMSAFHKMCYG